MSCLAHLGCWNEVEAGSGSRSLSVESSMSGPNWDEFSSKYESEMWGFKTETTMGSEGMFIPLSNLNGSYGDARIENGMK